MSILDEQWQLQESPLAFHSAIAWSEALSLAVVVRAKGTGFTAECMTSTNGIHWIQRSIPNGEYTVVAWSSGLEIFVALTRLGDTAISSNGIDWIVGTKLTGADWFGLCWAADRNEFLAARGSGSTNWHVARSANGTSWTLATLTGRPNGPLVYRALRIKRYLSSPFYSSPSTNYAVSSDGVTWDQQDIVSHSRVNGFVDSPWLNTVFAASADRILKSPDAVTWTQAVSGLGVTVQGLASADAEQMLVALRNDGGFRSIDGLVWLPIGGIPEDASMSRLVFAEALGGFIACGTHIATLGIRPPTTACFWTDEVGALEECSG